MGRRVLITGLSSFWGGRLAQALERDPSVEVIVGLDTADPVVALERTEFVRSDEEFAILARIVRATQVDTIVHAALLVDSSSATSRRIHEQNVIGTMNLLAAAGSEDSSVSTIVVKSSTLVYGAAQKDPAWFRETTRRSAAPRTAVERSLIEVEDYLTSFAEERPVVKVVVLRCANVLGDDLVTVLSRCLSLPLTPTIAGFDPQLQFVEQDDVIRAVEFVLHNGLQGVYNVAGDGKVPWSEIQAIVGRRPLLLSPAATAFAAAPLGRLGLVKLTPEALDVLRYGRGVDNRKLKSAGFAYRYTTAGAARHFAEAMRLRRIVDETQPTYRYQGDVESFFRHSSAVVRQS